MGWQEVVGHKSQIEQFQRYLSSGRLASAFLFIGPEGVGKHFFARKLTQALFCEVNPEQQCNPCGHCPSCQQVMKGTHPDLHYVAVLSGSKEIRTAQIVGGTVKSNNETDEYFPGICYEVNLKPIRAKRKVVIINDADTINATATANLLKTLEEPPPGAVIVLIGTSLSQQIDTIISRCQVVTFNSLLPEQVQQILLAKQIVETPEQAIELSMIANGSIGLASRYVETELLDVRRDLLEILAVLPQQPERLSDFVNTFIYKKGDSRRAVIQKMEFVSSVVVACFHQIAVRLSGQTAIGDTALINTSREIADAWQGDVETVLACIDRTLETAVHAQRNANVKTFVEAWVDDLSQIWSVGGFKLPTTWIPKKKPRSLNS